MTKQEIIRRALLAILAVLFGVTLAKTLSFATVDQTPPHWDYAGHLSNTIDYMTAVKNLDTIAAFSLFHFYPPFAYVLMAIFFIFFGYSEIVIVIFNFSLLLLLLGGVYWFMNTISDKFIALGAPLFVLGLVLTPVSINVKLWEFMLDFPQAVVIVLNYCLYFYSIRHSRFAVVNTLTLGVATALALLTKWTAAIFLAAPFMCYVFVAIRCGRSRSVLLLVAVVAVIAGVWYGFHMSQLYPELYFFANQEGILNQDPQGILGLIYYIEKINETLSWSFLLLGYAMWRSVILLLNVVKRKEKILVSFFDLFDVAFVLLPIFIFSFLIQNKNERYLYPIYILLPLIIFIRIVKNNSSTKIFFLVGTLCFAIYRIINYVPKPYTEKNALATTQEVFSTFKPKKIAYFFEDDTSFFNYSNVSLFHKELTDIYGHPVFYYYLNNHAIGSQRDQCVFSNFPDLVVVYSGSDPIRDAFSQHISYSESCVHFSDCYQLARIYDFAYERLRVYKRSDSCKTEA